MASLMKSLGVAVIPLVCFSFGAASAASIDVSVATSGSPLAVYTVERDFALPPGFFDASLNIEAFSADDRAVLFLNGTAITSTGIFGPGAGSMVLAPGGTNDPFVFEYGNAGPFTSITSGFVDGLNTLQFVVNNTGSGIFGFPTTAGGPTGLNFEAEVTFQTNQTGVVPLPATLPLLAVGLAGAFLAARRSRKA